MSDKKLYPDIAFTINELPGCCGIGVVGYFKEEEEEYNWYTKKRFIPKKKYTSREEQAEACYKSFIQKTGSDRDDYDYYTQLLISLVSSYKDEPEKHQFPELEAILLREGWTIYSVFVNPNHGNEVTLYGKYFPERHYEKNDDDYF